MTTVQTRPVLDTLGMQLTKSIDAKFAGMYHARVGFRRKKATCDRTAAKHAFPCGSRQRSSAAVRAFMFGSKKDTAEIERFLQGGFLLGGHLERTATDCKHAQRTCKDATQEDVHFALREVFEKWTHARTQVPVAQRMAATLKWGGKSSRGPGSVAEIFVRTILGKTITVAIGGVLTTDDLLKQIGVKVNLSSSGHGIEPVLNFAGCEVQAGRLLSDYNIQNHSVLQQTWRLHGGMEVDGSTSQPRAEDIDAQMRARADGWATVRDPLSNFTIDITKQCVNVSLSRDGDTAVGPPHPSITAHPACRSKVSPSSCARHGAPDPASRALRSLAMRWRNCRRFWAATAQVGSYHSPC